MWKADPGDIGIDTRRMYNYILTTGRAMAICVLHIFHAV